MIILDGIATLADRYDGFILDLWGVVHDGRAPYPGVAEALGALKARGKRVVFLSNAPRRSHVVEALLTGMGLDRALWDGMGAAHPRSSSLGPAGSRLARAPGDQPSGQDAGDRGHERGRDLHLVHARSPLVLDLDRDPGHRRQLDRDAQRIAQAASGAAASSRRPHTSPPILFGKMPLDRVPSRCD
ncbi:hypothetical protein J4558_16545 [Leptolyngbya sp. 15MV]|nr:hypothetical protein J4558_16545 [Leptolyngbya sp. 15MV]